MKRLFLAILVLFIIYPHAYAQNSTKEELDWSKLEEVDWDNLEKELYWIAIEEGLTDLAEIHERTGYTLLNTDNQWERATVHFKKALELDPKRYLSWSFLGWIFIDTEEGNEYFRKAIEANPDYAEPYYWLAYTYCRQRRDKEALPIFEKYLEVAEKDPDEEGRVWFAEKVVEELRSGKEGYNLRKTRRPEEKGL